MLFSGIFNIIICFQIRIQRESVNGSPTENDIQVDIDSDHTENNNTNKITDEISFPQLTQVFKEDMLTPSGKVMTVIVDKPQGECWMIEKPVQSKFHKSNNYFTFTNLLKSWCNSIDNLDLAIILVLNNLSFDCFLSNYKKYMNNIQFADQLNHFWMLHRDKLLVACYVCEKYIIFVNINGKQTRSN